MGIRNLLAGLWIRILLILIRIVFRLGRRMLIVLLKDLCNALITDNAILLDIVTHLIVDCKFPYHIIDILFLTFSFSLLYY